jgi:hypothetical protein
VIDALHAFAGGLWAIVRAPLLVAGVLLVTVASAAPFGALLAERLQASLAMQPPLEAWQGDIDPEWWAEFREHAAGLEATFTPAILGVAAPLDHLSAVLDGTLPPLAVLGPVAVAVLVWAFLWGGILDRFSRGRAAGPLGFVAAAWRHTAGLAVVSVVAAFLALVLYVTLHPLLFGPVYGWLSGQVSSEPAAFAWRVVLYAVFGSALAVVSLIADYSRIYLVSGRARQVVAALQLGIAFVSARLAAVLTLALLSGGLFVALLAAYGAIDIAGGTRVGGWRAVAIGQAYIVGRLALRLAAAASQVKLFQGPRW